MQSAEIINYLRFVSDSNDLDSLSSEIKQLEVGEWSKNLKHKECLEICSSLGEKTLEILDKGEIPKRSILWAYGIFSRVEAREFKATLSKKLRERERERESY